MGALGALMLSLAFATAVASTVLHRPEPSPWIYAGEAATMYERGLVKLPGRDIYVSALHEYIAFEAVYFPAPGTREVVELCPSSKMFESPFTGAKFDRFGRSHTARFDDLPTRAVRIRDGKIYVHVNARGNERLRASLPPADRRGPFCD